MYYFIHVFIPSFIEIFSVLCILGIMRKSYVQVWKMAVACVGLATTTTILDYFHIDMNLGLNILFLAIILLSLYRLKILQVIFDSAFAIFFYSTLQMVVFLSINLVNYNLLDHKEPLNLASVVIVVFAALFLIALSNQKLTSWLRKKYSQYQEVIQLGSINFVLIQLVYTYNWNTSKDQLATNNVVLTGFLFMILIANLLLIFMAVERKKQHEELKQQRILDIMKEEFLEKMVAQQHEFSKHLETIMGLAKKENIEEGRKLIEEYTMELLGSRMEKTKNAYAGDGIVSAFLQEKESEAKEKGINFGSLVKSPLPEFPCARPELIELIGNLVNNAFDAMEAIPEDQRKVYIEVGERSGQVYLQVMNSIAPDSKINLVQIGQKGFSTKEGEHRGYGLYNIRTIAEKYNGKMIMDINDEVFIVQVLF